MNQQKKSFASFFGRKSTSSKDNKENKKGKSPNTEKEDLTALLGSLPLNERFPCPSHPHEYIKYFIPPTARDDKIPSFLCEKCQYIKTNLNLVSVTSFEEVSEVLGEGNVMLPLEELSDYFLRKYNEFRKFYEENSSKNAYIEHFLQTENDICQDITQSILEQQQKIEAKVNHLIDLFVCQINEYRDQLLSLLSTQLETFIKNVKYTRENSLSFLLISESFKNLPTLMDFDRSIEELTTQQNLDAFASSHTTRLKALQDSLRDHQRTVTTKASSIAGSTLSDLDIDVKEPVADFSGYINRQKLSLNLIKKIYQNVREPPQNDLTSMLDSSIGMKPFEILSQVLLECVGPSTAQPITLKNSIEEFEKTLNENSLIKKDDHVGSANIDALNYFYPTTHRILQSLHYYDPNERALSLINIADIAAQNKNNGIQQDPVPRLRIALPRDTKIARFSKTIALPEGCIYFIGGENSAQTLAFDYQVLPEALNVIEETPNSKTNASSKKGRSSDEKKGSQATPESSKNNSPLKAQDEIIGKPVLSFKANMNKPRHAHSLVFVESGSIYAIGGFENATDRNPTTHCERYLIREDRWTYIKECNYGVSHPNLVFVDNKYIFKYGGYFEASGKPTDFIEKYDIENDFWTEVKMHHAGSREAISILPKSSIVQINEKEILVLGGQTETFEFSGQCHIVEKSDDRLIAKSQSDLKKDSSKNEEEAEENEDRNNKKSTNMILPREDMFVSQSVIHEGKLYCLSLKPTLSEIISSVFMFDGRDWSVVL